MTKSSKKPKKSSLSAPYQNNPEIPIHQVKKNMRTQMLGPTVDMFSNLDTTTNTDQPESAQIEPKRIRRPTKEKIKKFPISTENIILTIFSIIAAGIGKVVYDHGSQFVSLGKDIEYIQKDLKSNSDDVEKLKDKTISIDKKVDLLNQKIELSRKK